MKIIITGGVGFIFSYVTEYFVKKGYDVMVFDNLSEGSHPEIIDSSFWFRKQDISKNIWMDMARRFNPDYIIHAAAISDVDFSIKHPQVLMDRNLKGTMNIFELARTLPNLKKLLYVSTDEVYGECEHPRKEDEIIFPKNPYALSKAFGSLARLTYDNSFPELKDKTLETRFCNVFGERQDTRKILPNIKEGLKGKPIVVHNGGEGYREYIYVKNIPPLIDLLLEKGDRTYNITLNEGYTVNQLIDRVAGLTGKTLNVIKGERAGMDMKYQMDNSRIMELGWKPLYTFDEGIKEYLC